MVRKSGQMATLFLHSHVLSFYFQLAFQLGGVTAVVDVVSHSADNPVRAVYHFFKAF